MINKIKGTVRALFSFQFLVLVILLVGVGLVAGLYLGNWQTEDVFGSDIQDVNQNDTTVYVQIAEDHDSDRIGLRHKHQEDYYAYSTQLDPFGGPVVFDAQHVRCDRADWPSTEFEIVLSSLDSDGQLKDDQTYKIDLSEEFVYGECDFPINSN